ncbi:MAG: hypothetical protein EXR51_02905 [Dehalococcoidia bacterium]|nr:hypothetical protein [Dehalococcoidia bacterium]
MPGVQELIDLFNAVGKLQKDYETNVLNPMIDLVSRIWTGEIEAPTTEGEWDQLRERLQGE